MEVIKIVTVSMIISITGLIILILEIMIQSMIEDDEILKGRK